MTTLRSATLRLGTRRSALALAQSKAIMDRLLAVGHNVDLVEIVTEGDQSSEAVTAIGSTGVFVNELRKQLREHAIDIAVHSYKDLPTQREGGIAMAAVPRRADPRDALVSRDNLALAELPAGTRIGTGSPRRTAQLRALGLGLTVEPIRGNVDTRLRKVADGELDAVVVAAAGLQRLGRSDEASEILDPGQMLPAPAQGALAVECRTGDTQLAVALAEALNDRVARAAVDAERALLAKLEAGCSAPVGALADVSTGDDGEDEIYLRGVVAAIDGSHAIRLSKTGPMRSAVVLGEQLAADLLQAGAADLIGNNK